MSINKHEFVEDVVDRCERGLDWLLRTECAYTPEQFTTLQQTSRKIVKSLANEVCKALEQAASDGIISETCAVAIARAQDERLIQALTQPLDSVLSACETTSHLGCNGSLWDGFYWLNDSPSLIQIRRSTDVM